MKKSKENSILIILFILIFFISLLIFISFKFTGYIIKEQKKQVQFYFYDENSCSLNGYVFSGNKLIGKTENGYFNLTYTNYKANFNTQANISVFGKLGSCFGKNSELFFDKYWGSFEIKEYYFDGESLFKFGTKISPNNPTKRALIGFIQVEKVKPYLYDINTTGNVLKDLPEINKYLNNKISYVKDWDFNKETNYWQTSLETLNLKQGDCEDFSTLLLSLFLAYDPSLNCFNIVFPSHVTTFCHIDNYYIYYDQEKTELKKQISDIGREETEKKLEELRKEYFEHYGINKSERAYYAFNDNEYIEFNSEGDFIDWQYNLDNKKINLALFEELEKQVSEIEKIDKEIELATQKPITELATEKPTIKGFLKENFTLILVLGIIFIVLVIILIKINRK